MIARLTARYLAVFAFVLLALSIVAYVFVQREYQSIYPVVLATPESAAAFRTAMFRVAFTIVAFDVPLLVIVGSASYFLAHASLQPLLAAREREREFAADAAHELRSPLATIATVAQAARPNAPPELVDALETITAAALDASALVGDLLTLARDPNADLLQCEPLDLQAVVEHCKREFVERARARSVNVRAQVESAIVNGDERRLKELIRNLLENAVRHARSAVEISIALHSSSAFLTITNDGDTIPLEMREKVFERFVRANGTSSEGSGLGLPIVRWIAQAHGGEVTIAPVSTGGTQAALRLPLL